MGGIAEMAKKQEASVRRRMHREEGLKQIPTTNNYIDLTIVDLKLRNITFENNSVITVVDILATEEKDTKLQTTIHKTDPVPRHQQRLQKRPRWSPPPGASYRPTDLRSW